MVFHVNSVRQYLTTKPTNSVFKVDVHGKIVDQSMDFCCKYAQYYNSSVLKTISFIKDFKSKLAQASKQRRLIMNLLLIN